MMHQVSAALGAHILHLAGVDGFHFIKRRFIQAA